MSAIHVHYSHPIFEIVKCDLPADPPDERYEVVVEWLHTEFSASMNTMTMARARFLKDYFPYGPAPEIERRIDVIVITEKSMPFAYISIPS